MSFDNNFHVKKERPEDRIRDVRNYFRGDTLVNYAYSKNINKIQEKITKRLLELLEHKNTDKLILDAGCGPGFASFYLRHIGYKVVSLDLIANFLIIYDMSAINPVNGDMCYLPFKPNVFDAIVSISALQWIYRGKNDKLGKQRMIALVKSFHRVLKEKGKIIIQFYPKSKSLLEEIGKTFVNYSSLEGGYVVDNQSNPKKRRVFLKLSKP
jgi:SAM-dependent methyltransferase